MTDAPDLTEYRPTAGLAIFHRLGGVFLGRRVGSRDRWCWQMPQGGVDPGESAEDAAFRELEEETGLHARDVELLATIERWITYDYPSDIRARLRRRGRDWKGQKQRWFALRLTAGDEAIRLGAHHTPEFDAWRWERLDRVAPQVIPWKRHVYEAVAEEFAGVGAAG